MNTTTPWRNINIRRSDDSVAHSSDISVSTKPAQTFDFTPTEKIVQPWPLHCTQEEAKFIGSSFKCGSLGWINPVHQNQSSRRQSWPYFTSTEHILMVISASHPWKVRPGPPWVAICSRSLSAPSKSVSGGQHGGLTS